MDGRMVFMQLLGLPFLLRMRELYIYCMSCVRRRHSCQSHLHLMNAHCKNDLPCIKGTYDPRPKVSVLYSSWHGIRYEKLFTYN